MKKPKGFTLIEILVVIAVLVITAAGGVVVWEKKMSSVHLSGSTSIITPTPTVIGNQIQKIADECGVNSDCEYIWFAGGCHTPEYVKAVLDRAEKEGMRLGEAPRREGVVCECQNNRCVGKKTLVYKADKDMCGEIVFKERLGGDFDSALKKITGEKKEEFSKSCPDNPCQDVMIETKKAQEVRDLNNNLVDVYLYFIIVKDKNTNLKVHAISEAIDADGNLYNLNWCPD